jgi:hypothetical protein
LCLLVHLPLLIRTQFSSYKQIVLYSIVRRFTMLNDLVLLKVALILTPKKYITN